MTGGLPMSFCPMLPDTNQTAVIPNASEESPVKCDVLGAWGEGLKQWKRRGMLRFALHDRIAQTRCHSERQ